MLFCKDCHQPAGFSQAAQAAQEAGGPAPACVCTGRAARARARVPPKGVLHEATLAGRADAAGRRPRFGQAARAALCTTPGRPRGQGSVVPGCRARGRGSTRGEAGSCPAATTALPAASARRPLPSQGSPARSRALSLGGTARKYRCGRPAARGMLGSVVPRPSASAGSSPGARHAGDCSTAVGTQGTQGSGAVHAGKCSPPWPPGRQESALVAGRGRVPPTDPRALGAEAAGFPTPRPGCASGTISRALGRVRGATVRPTTGPRRPARSPEPRVLQREDEPRTGRGQKDGE